MSDFTSTHNAAKIRAQAKCCHLVTIATSTSDVMTPPKVEEQSSFIPQDPIEKPKNSANNDHQQWHTTCSKRNAGCLGSVMKSFVLEVR